MRAQTAASPIFFGPTRELFAFYHAPLTAQRAGSVVLCPPHGWDFEATYRAYGDLAERLALAGFAVLRFHYDGTGNSTGADHDPARLQTWCSDLGHAVAEVRARSGEHAVSVFGVRIGGLVAALTAPKLDGISAMVLWAPTIAGKTYVRELKAMRLINPNESILTGKVLGGEEAGGFMLSAQTVAALGAVKLVDTPVGSKRYLVLGRDDLPRGDDKFLAHLTANGAEVTAVDIPGYQAMMVDPLDSVIPSAAWDRVVAYLSDVHPLATTSHSREPTTSDAVSQVRMEAGAPLVRERAVRFGGDSELFGIVTEPTAADERAAGTRTGVIYLNTGANPHMGPHRMYVPLARELATRGIVSLRFDLEGFADSPPRAASPPDSYSPFMVDNTRTAIDFLQTTCGVNRIVVAGMCSGAYHAFHTALVDSRVTATLLLRPQVFSWEKDEALDQERRKNYRIWRYYLNRTLDRDAWLKALRGQARYDSIVGAIAGRVRTIAVDGKNKIVSRLRGEDRNEPKLAKRFRTLLERNSTVVLVYSKEDAGLDHLKLQVGDYLAALRAKDNFKLVLMDGKDYTFAATVSQDQLKEVVSSFMISRFI